MRIAAITISVLAGAASYMTFAQQRGSESIIGNWAVHLSDNAGKFQLMLERSSGKHHMSHSNDDVPTNQFVGLSMDQLNSAQGSVARFQISREAGVLECEGYVKAGGGGGVFHFMANINYLAAMQSLGYRDLDNEKAFVLSLHDVTTTFVRDMKALGYADISFDKLVAMRIHGVSTDFVKDIRALGLSTSSIDQLIAMRIHGVTPAYIREMRAVGLGTNSNEKLIAFRIHGVSPDYVHQVRSTFPNVTPDQLVAMRIHGVTPDFITRMSSRGMKDLSIDQLVSLKIHGLAN